MSEKILIATNKRATHDYEIVDRFEAGMVLTGSEIKSIRARNVNIKGSFVTLRGTTPMLTGMHISQYKPAADSQHEPERSRVLLLKKSEIEKISAALSQKGISAMPLEIYLKGKWAKVLIGIGKGKKKYDKRQTIKEREVKRRTERVVKGSLARRK